MPHLGRFVWVKHRTTPFFLCANCDTKQIITRHRSVYKSSPLESRARRTLIDYGLPFEEQKPIERWIFDFAVPMLALMIETDGRYHQFRMKKDRAKTKSAEKLGWAVVHLTSDDLEGKLVAALDKRFDEVEAQRKAHQIRVS
jgi:very-short-patch-repair endonuclease